MISDLENNAAVVPTQHFYVLDNVHYNAQMTIKQIHKFCKLDDTFKELFKSAMERLNLSACAYDCILKVARTIADLENVSELNGNHIAEAIQYRSLDREGRIKTNCLQQSCTFLRQAGMSRFNGLFMVLAFRYFILNLFLFQYFQLGFVFFLSSVQKISKVVFGFADR